MKKIDLHMHSLYSDDGEFEPIELLDMCKKAGLSYMAIADHNSVKGSRIALQHQKEYDMVCIPAIEIDAVAQGVGYHILGYGIDVHHPVFNEIEENVVQQEKKASIRRRQLVRDLGIEFDEKRILELSPEGITTGEAIAQAAMEYDHDHTHPLLQPYYSGGNRSDNPYVNFYWDYCSEGKAAYVEIVYPSLKAVVELLHQQGALAIVAHPGMNAKERSACIEELLSLGVDGFEVYSSYHTPKQTAFYYELAKRHGLWMSCGSDFHGKTKPAVQIGMCTMDAYENERLINKLEELIRV